MSKEMTDVQLLAHFSSSIDAIRELLQDWHNSGNPKKLKKAQLLAYWLSDYSAMLRKEDSFDPSSIPRLRRGSVVVVDFGFRIGSEFGGRHFAVVVDNDNRLNSPVVTVVPLFSLKDTYKESKYTVILPCGIYMAFAEKIESVISKTTKMINEASHNADYLNNQFYKEAVQVVQEAKDVKAEVSKLKCGSVANTCQVTTISKLRIKRPHKGSDPLSGIHLTTDDMDLINNQLKALIIYEK